MQWVLDWLCIQGLGHALYTMPTPGFMLNVAPVQDQLGINPNMLDQYPRHLLWLVQDYAAHSPCSNQSEICSGQSEARTTYGTGPGAGARYGTVLDQPEQALDLACGTSGGGREAEPEQGDPWVSYMLDPAPAVASPGLCHTQCLSHTGQSSPWIGLGWEEVCGPNLACRDNLCTVHLAHGLVPYLSPDLRGQVSLTSLL